MKRRRRRVVRWGLLPAAVAAGVLGVAWWSARREAFRPVAVFTGVDDGSVERARRMGGTGGRPPAFLFTRYFWLSPDEALFWQESPWMRASTGMVRRDVRSKRATPFAPPRGVPPQSRPISLSPDGKWLLLYAHVFGDKPGTRLYAVPLDGSQPAQVWPLGDTWVTEDLVAGAPKGGRWFLTRPPSPQPNRPELAVYTVGSSAPAAFSFSTAPMPPGAWLSLLSVTPQNRLLVADLRATMNTGGGSGAGVLKHGIVFDPTFKTLEVAAYDVEPASGRPAAGQKPRHFSLPMPVHVTPIPFTKPMQCVLSPGGDRLAWLIVGTPRRTPLVQRLFAFFHVPPPAAQASIWVSDLDGSRPPRPICRIGLGDKQPVPVQLAWTPDGKRLSYLHDGALWTVPAK